MFDTCPCLVYVRHMSMSGVCPPLAFFWVKPVPCHHSHQVPLREHRPPHNVAGAATYLNSFYATADAPVYPTVAWVSSNSLPGTAVKAKPLKHVAQPYMQSSNFGGSGGSKSSPSKKPKQQHEQVQFDARVRKSGCRAQGPGKWEGTSPKGGPRPFGGRTLSEGVRVCAPW